MRKVLIRLLAAFRRLSLWWLQLRGKTEQDVAAQRIVSGQSWDEFCDTLKAAGAALNFPGAPRDPFNQAEGYRYLTRLARAGLMAFLEHADPRAPVLHRVVHETVKMGADNPDNFYQTACISGEYDYVIRGQRNTVKYLGFGTQIGHYGQGGGLPPSGYLESSAIELEADGSFLVHVSCKPHAKNWLPMQPQTGCLIVRQTFLDRTQEVPADLIIERVDGDAIPTPLTPKQVDDGLKSASTLVAGAALLFAKWARDFQRHSNQLPLFDPAVSTAAGGDPNIRYYHSHWALAPDEALLIEVTPPACEHWNFQLNNYWMESLDYVHFQIHTNKHLAHYEKNGAVKIIVAHQDPGLPNWLSTAGHESGTMCFRWIKLQSPDSAPQPQTRVVNFSHIARSNAPHQTTVTQGKTRHEKENAGDLQSL